VTPAEANPAVNGKLTQGVPPEGEKKWGLCSNPLLKAGLGIGAGVALTKGTEKAIDYLQEEPPPTNFGQARYGAPRLAQGLNEYGQPQYGCSPQLPPSEETSMTTPASGTGSGFSFAPAGPELAPLRRNGGPKSEVLLLRRQLRDLLFAAALLHCQEYVNPVAASVNAFVLAVTIPEATALVYQKGSSRPLDGALASTDVPYGRNVTVTTVGADGLFNFPFDVVVEGLDVYGQVVTETITVTALASPGTIAGSKIFKSVTKVTIPAAGTAATTGTVSVGFGAVLGLPSTPAAARGGAAAPKAVQEIANGAVVTTGTLSAANRSYTPAAAPDATKSYYVVYEADAGAILARIPALPAVDPSPGLLEKGGLLPTQAFPVLGAPA